MKYLIAILFPLVSLAQNADWKELQGKIDSAVKYNGRIEINRNYKIDRPLVAASWTGTDYKQFTIQIVGNATMWDVGQSSVIKATFTDAPILSIHKSKGSIIRGVNFQGAGVNGRDSRFSPYCAIAIDPFRYNLPADSGYPVLRSWYRGSQSKGGSTGIRVEDCTANNVVVGFITSPNGHTQNAELITFENIRIGNCKVGIAGCQAQEKMNRVINIGCWSECKYLFAWNMYGEMTPGNWIIDGVNIAGQVDNILYRDSHGYFPLFMKNVYAESILSIGTWRSQVGDMLEIASINFRKPTAGVAMADHNLLGNGITFRDCSIRYYGMDYPLLMYGTNTMDSSIKAIVGKGLNTNNNKEKYTTFKEQDIVLSNGRAVINGNDPAMKKGDLITFFNVGNWEFAGQGLVDSVGSGVFYVGNLSAAIQPGKRFGSGRYKK